MNELTHLARQFLEQKQRAVKTGPSVSSPEAVPKIVPDLPLSQTNDTIVIEPATCKPVWYQSTDGTLRGPCEVSFVGRTGEAGGYEFWLCVEVAGQTRWIRDSLLLRAPVPSKP